MNIICYGYWNAPSCNGSGYVKVYAVAETNYIPQYRSGQNQFDYVKRINAIFGQGSLFLTEDGARAFAEELSEFKDSVINIGCFNCPSPVEVLEFLAS